MLQRPFINKTLVYRYLLFSERSLKMVSQNPVKKKRVSRSFNHQNTYFFDLTLSANEIPPVFNFLLLKRPTNVLAIVDY